MQISLSVVVKSNQVNLNFEYCKITSVQRQFTLDLLSGAAVGEPVFKAAIDPELFTWIQQPHSIHHRDLNF